MRVIFLCFQSIPNVIGVKYLHAYIRSKGYDSSILVIPSSKATVRAALDFVVKNNPDVLCFSIMEVNFNIAHYFSCYLRPLLPHCTFIFGGVYATISPEECLEVCDIAVRGEGEQTLHELLKILERKKFSDIEAVPNVVFKKDGRCVYNPLMPPLKDIDILPYPRHMPEETYMAHGNTILNIRDKRSHKLYNCHFIDILTSRGCPFSCRYCFNQFLNSLYGSAYLRFRAVDSVIDEIKTEVRDFDKIRHIVFIDDCFTMHSMEWMENFSRRYAKEIKIPFFIKTPPAFVNEKRLRLLKDAGLAWVSMGLESGSQRINKEVYGRDVPESIFLSAVNTVSAMNISLSCNIIVDNPYETEDDINKTFDMLLKIPRPYVLKFNSLIFFRGTEIRRMALKDKISLEYLERRPGAINIETSITNIFYQMCAVFSPWVLRPFFRRRHKLIGKIFGLFFTLLFMIYLPFAYVWLYFKSTRFNLKNSLEVIIDNTYYWLRMLFSQIIFISPLYDKRRIKKKRGMVTEGFDLILEEKKRM